MGDVLGDEVSCLVEMYGYVALIFVEGRDVFIVGHCLGRVPQLVAFRAAHHSCDAVFWIAGGVLLRVLRFSAASMLLMKSEPLEGSAELTMHSMSSGNLLARLREA